MADRENPFGQSVAQGSTLMTQNVNAPIGAFGGLTAAALSRGGQDMQQAGAQVVNFAQRLKQRRSASDIMGAMTQAQKAMQDAWYDPENGFARRTGLSADGLHEDVSATVDRIGREAMANIRDKDAQELFMQRWGVEGIQHMGKAAEWEMHQLDNGHTDQVNDWAAVLQADIEADPSITPEEISKHLAEAETFISGVFDGNETGKQLAEKVKGKLVASSIIGMVNANDYDTATKTLGNKEMQKLLAVGGFDVGKMTQSVESKRQEYQSFELGKQMAGMSIDKKLEMTHDLDPQAQQRALNIANAIEGARKEAHSEWQLNLNRSLLGAVADYMKELEAGKTIKTSSQIFVGDLAKQFESLDGEAQVSLLSRIDAINSGFGSGGGSRRSRSEGNDPGTIYVGQSTLFARDPRMIDKVKWMTSPEALNNALVKGVLDSKQVEQLTDLRGKLVDNGWRPLGHEFDNDPVYQVEKIVDAATPFLHDDVRSMDFGAPGTYTDSQMTGMDSTLKKDIRDFVLGFRTKEGKFPEDQMVQEFAQRRAVIRMYQMEQNEYTKGQMNKYSLQEFGGMDFAGMTENDRQLFAIFQQKYTEWEDTHKDNGIVVEPETFKMMFDKWKQSPTEDFLTLAQEKITERRVLSDAEDRKRGIGSPYANSFPNDGRDSALYGAGMYLLDAASDIPDDIARNREYNQKTVFPNLFKPHKRIGE